MRRRTARAIALHVLGATAWALVGSAACADERERIPYQECVTWTEVSGALAEACAGCHDVESMSGNYDVSTYLSTLGPGSDGVANAIAGDQTSRLLTALDPRSADMNHAGFGELHATLTRWVVDCELSYARSRIHEGGIMNPADPAFHGALLETLAWDFDRCAQCHGADFAGGSSGASCLSCHERGPTDCQTCHGPMVTSGAHLAHTTDAGTLGALYECQACHVMPEDYRDPGHLFVIGAPGTVDIGPAEVVFDDRAQGPDASRPPDYDPATGRCADVYCHGASLGDERAQLIAPQWDDGAAGAACGSCHGLAPSSHADDRCQVCHQRVVDENRLIIGPALHIDKDVSIGAGTGDTCTDCHGPPRDLSGRTDTDLITVGAHQSHVDGRHGLSAPIPCSDCHATPQLIDSPGHIDSPAPAELFIAPDGPFTGLAAAGGAVPIWDRVSATCSDVYCHGGGTTSLADDTAPGLLRTPIWIALDAGQAACGTCHGAPPSTAAHQTSTSLQDCHTCHPGTVDPFGNILISGPAGARTSEHIDGELDL